MKAAFFLWSLALWGCAPPPAMRHDWSPAQGLEALLGRAGRELQAIADLRAQAELTLDRDGQRRHASAAILFKQPDLLRVEVQGPFFTPLFTAVAQAESLTVCDAEGAWRRGAVSGPLLAELTGLDLGGYDLRYALLGLVAPAPLDSIAPQQQDLALVFLRGAPPRRLWIDARRGFAVREELLDEAGRPVLIRRLQDYQRVGDIYLPRRVELRQGENAIALEYRSWELNTGLAGELFTRGIPLDRLERLE